MRTLIADPAIHAYPGMVAVVTSRHNGVQNVMASGSTYFVADDTLQKKVYPFYLNK
nr:hypothetical protein [Paenibacillus maysiensis]